MKRIFLAVLPALPPAPPVALALLPLLACTLAAAPLAAQGIPGWAVGVDAGAGPRTQRAGETYYIGSNDGTLRLTGQVRLARVGRVAPILHLEGAYRGEGDQVAICGIAPDGSCRQYAPGNGGWGIGAGLALAPVRLVEVSVVAGRGRYGGTWRDFVGTRLALSPVRHLAVTASLTHMTWKEPGGAPHWFRPLHVGLRIE